MTNRFAGLRKIPEQPAARLLALANARLGVRLEAPASALVPEVLAELELKNAMIDMLRLLAVALPARERIWWACLAARDLLGHGLADSPLIVEATEAWVFKPDERNQIAVRRAIEAAPPDDLTNFCGNACLTWDGRMGPQELRDLAAPPGACETYALVMNIHALVLDPTSHETRAGVLVERALNIARGGRGTEQAAAPLAQNVGN